MTIYEMRLIAVLGLLAIGVIALAASFAVAHLQGLARHLKGGVVHDAARPLARGDARDVATALNRRSAA
jgi:hypothetical protein